MTAPDRLWPPHTLPFSTTATGTSPSRSTVAGSLGEELEQPVGARQPGGAAADDGDSHLDEVVLGVKLALDELFRRLDGGGIFARDDDAVVGPFSDTALSSPFFAFTASVSFGRILLRSPMIPRSENSKIGAFYPC